MRKALKVVAVNLAVLLVLVSLANVASSAFMYFYYKGQRGVSLKDPVLSYPVFHDKKRAFTLFDEFSKLRAEYHSYVGLRRLPFRGELTTVDEAGLRVHPAHGGDRPDAKRVGFFGGSTMWGTGSADDETIPALVDRASDAIVTLNLAESGYTSRQDLEMLINVVNLKTPLDVAVFYDGANDVALYCRAGQAVNTDGQTDLIRTKMRRERDDAIVFLKVMEPVITLVEKAGHKLRFGSLKEIPFDCDKDPARAEGVADLMLSNWRNARAIAQANGLEFYALLQPVAYVGTSDIAYLPPADAMAAQFRAVYPALKRKIAQDSSGWMFDLSDVFDGTGPLYFDFCHVPGRGNAMVAKRIVELLGRAQPRR